MLHLKAIECKNVFAENCRKNSGKSFWGSEIIFPAHFIVKHSCFFNYNYYLFVQNFTALSSGMKRIDVLYCYFKNFLEFFIQEICWTFFFIFACMVFSSSGRLHLTSAKWNEGRMGGRWGQWVEKNCWKHCPCYRPR